MITPFDDEELAAEIRALHLERWPAIPWGEARRQPKPLSKPTTTAAATEHCRILCTALDGTFRDDRPGMSRKAA